MTSHDWKPNAYLQFKNERIQPAIDLVSRINFQEAKKLLDVGCGPGNSTEILLQKWPRGQVSGIDSSPAMIAKAREDYPTQDWQIVDAVQCNFENKYDVVFSNAAIQWMPNHKDLLHKFLNMVNDKGALAVQLPLYHEMPISGVVDHIFQTMFTDECAFNVNSDFTFHSAQEYYDILQPLSKKIDIWETSYYHVMESHQDIIEMIKTTGMKRYLEKIKSPENLKAFESAVLRNLKEKYPAVKNGSVLFPFKRLFFIAYK